MAPVPILPAPVAATDTVNMIPVNTQKPETCANKRVPCAQGTVCEDRSSGPVCVNGNHPTLFTHR